MGVGRLEENAREIMKHKDPETPVCVIEQGTLPDQRIITGTLKDITNNRINTPALVIVGNVVEIYKNAHLKRTKIKKGKP